MKLKRREYLFKNHFLTKIDLDLSERLKFKHIFTGKGYSQMTFFWKNGKKNHYFFGKDYDSNGIKNFVKLGWVRKGKNSDTKVSRLNIGGKRINFFLYI